ncbi:golgin subfamily A member 6-like protein 22 [Bombus pyrosoma]|uniref:golgin subfamily A member 6-like protein 22 n=1 Tax=Bombus pyrosoma TaxID=396416 RepID=UPI001CB8990D|nr:golgin subfamily A member 6-like protein 22 [Bombus pyrosoma]
MKVGKRTESDHMPLEAEIEGPELQKTEEREEEEKERREWTRESREKYLEECKDWTYEGRTTEELWTDIKNKVNNAVPKRRVKTRKWGMGEEVWYDKEWKERKREVRRKMAKFRRGKCGREELMEEKKAFKLWCKERKERHEEEEMEKIRKIRTEQEVWKYINKYRRRREEIDEEISEEEWRNHFMEMLEGKEHKEDRKAGEQGEEEEIGKEREDNIEKEEVIYQIRKLKEKKATGEDGIENEVWKYAPMEVGEALWELVRKIWKGQGIPEDWKKGVICPIYKKGDKRVAKSYRGITLMDTAYKIYAGILDERLKAEVETKLEERQFGFRKGRGVTDAVFVISHIIDKQLSRERGKLFACFADLRAAFDRLNREKLEEKMKKMGVSENLTRRIKELYSETKNVVRVKNRNTEAFWTVRGVRQGCPLSPTLFNIYVAGLEDELRKGQAGGIAIGGRKVWSLTYADDIVLMADREEELKEMLRKFKKLLKEAELELGTEKTKIVDFEKRRNKRRQRKWSWGEQELEEVEEIRHLGYILQKNGSDERHIQDRKRRAMIAMKKTWSIGERIFKQDYERRMKTFEALVESVALFEAEVWGWNMEESLDRVKRGYVKWILGLDRTTPNYILTEECKIEEMKVRALKRAVRYEERSLESEKELNFCYKRADDRE